MYQFRIQTLNITQQCKKAQQQLCFLWRKFIMSPKILSSFYSCTVESILTGCIPIWYHGIWSRSCSRSHRRAASVLKDPTHLQPVTDFQTQNLLLPIRLMDIYPVNTPRPYLPHKDILIFILHIHCCCCCFLQINSLFAQLHRG